MRQLFSNGLGIREGDNAGEIGVETMRQKKQVRARVLWALCDKEHMSAAPNMEEDLVASICKGDLT